MNEMREIIFDMANRLMSDFCTQESWTALDEGVISEDLWTALNQQGLLLAGVSEDLGGGAGLNLDDLMGLVRISGYHACPVPCAETILYNWLADRFGQSPTAGLATLAFGIDAPILKYNGDDTLSGSLSRVLWAGSAASVLVLCEKGNGFSYLGAVAPSKLKNKVEKTTNISGESCADFRLETDTYQWLERLPEDLPTERLHALTALMRSCQMVGVMERVLDMALTYVMEREQFGRPLAKFQAVQHMLAEAAQHYSAASVISKFAAQNYEADDFELLAAVAKARASEAVRPVIDAVHQCHGAMGFTREYPLQFFTRRLWSWRDESGSEVLWNRIVGKNILEDQGIDLWPNLTRAGQNSS